MQAIKTSTEIDFKLLTEKYEKGLKEIDFYKKIRLLHWNFILKNIQLYSKRGTYIFVDQIKKIKEDDDANQKIKDFMDRLEVQYGVNQSDPRYFKAKLMTEGWSPLFLTNGKDNEIFKEDFEGRFGIKNKIAKEIKDLCSFLNYDIQLADIFPIFNKQGYLDQINVVFLENNISLKV